MFVIAGPLFLLIVLIYAWPVMAARWLRVHRWSELVRPTAAAFTMMTTPLIGVFVLLVAGIIHAPRIQNRIGTIIGLLVFSVLWLPMSATGYRLGKSLRQVHRTYLRETVGGRQQTTFPRIALAAAMWIITGVYFVVASLPAIGGLRALF
jgi:hypothetical protein